MLTIVGLEGDGANPPARRQRYRSGTGILCGLCRYRCGFPPSSAFPSRMSTSRLAPARRPSRRPRSWSRYERLLLESAEPALPRGRRRHLHHGLRHRGAEAHVPVAHVEAGIRSGDWTMPEEINRMVTDAITNWFFTTSETANAEPARAGVRRRAHLLRRQHHDRHAARQSRPAAPAVVLGRARPLVRRATSWSTLHRPANVDAAASFASLLEGYRRRHARPAGRVPRPSAHGAGPWQASPTCLPAIRFVEPQPYLEFIYLVRHARAVITDSGGITEETTVLGVPCMTLRDTTERPETVTVGTNELLGTDPAALAPALERLFAGQWKKGGIPEKWDGRAGERIVATLESLLPT